MSALAGVRFTGCTVHFVRPKWTRASHSSGCRPHFPMMTQTVSQPVLEQEHIIYHPASR